MNGRSQTNRLGVLFGVALGVLASFQLCKVPLALPMLLGAFHYSKLLAGALMSVYAVMGLLFSVYLGKIMAGENAGSPCSGQSVCSSG